MKNIINAVKSIRKSKNYSAAFLTLLITVSIALPMMAMTQTASAEAGISIKTYALLSVGPNPVGVDQKLAIVMWLDKLPPVPAVQTSTVRAIPFTNFTLEVTKPNGEMETFGPFTSDATGSAATSYVPDTVGNYTFQVNYGGEWLTGARVAGANITTDYYQPSKTQKVTVVVQEEPIYATPGAPLPTEYWTRPIDARNYEWETLGGNWLGLPLQFATGCNEDGTFNPYSAAPKTSHVLWSIPQSFGGIVGDNFNESDYYTGLSYQAKFNYGASAVVLNGRLYYHPTYGPAATSQGLSCVDLATGKELWFLNGTRISFGQLLSTENMNVHGVNSYLWNYASGTSTMYDAYTGLALLKVTGCQAATKVAMSETGDVLVYTLNANAKWLSLWNSTKAINPTDELTFSPSLTKTYNWADGLMYNVTIPDISGQTLSSFGDGVLITAAAFREADPAVRTVAGYDTATGKNLWIMNLTDYTIRPQYNFSPVTEGCFAWFKQETTEWYGFDAQTGKKLWGPTEPYADSYGMYSASFAGAGAPNPQVAYGKIFTAGYDGVVHAIDIKTGKTVWEFSSGATIDTVYGHYPFYGGVSIADGVVFATANEHTPNDPLWRGAKVYAINATDGTPVWNISSWATGTVVADGKLLEYNNYDSELYTFGKGTSSTTVDAPMNAATLGSSVTIRGRVIDTSPGTQQSELALRFPEGVPAVADQSMSGWMEYLYMQQARPADTEGVPVTLSVVDGNGNYREIGTTKTTDGFFTFNWKPDIEGQYTVYASFAGSESYWPSHAVTSFAVDPAAATPAPSPSPAPSMADTYLLPGIAAIIVVIVLVGAAIILVLRKRP
ncbi:MAG: PQQ-binding-like beta-propeller repeat protein [Candidatus Bathyarchaeota archaeon]|nr:PQQ-binding-like beta-propeller repeat protein [Candidatus Bathyarchaeota archaeon]